MISTSFTGKQINHTDTVAIKPEICMIFFSCHGTLKLIAHM